MTNLYASIPNVTDLISVNITQGHDLATATAIVVARTTALTLGDSVSIDIGYTTNHAQMFTGVVKQIERNVPEDTVTITAYDNMVMAQDFFIASGNPEAPLRFSNIDAEDLVTELMSLADLTVGTVQDTFFTFGVQNAFEVNLISVYDYCRMIGDTLTWSIWADYDGTIVFANRKPYPMVDEYPENLQPGWAVDTPIAYTLNAGKWIDLTYTQSERLLRNRVVVYGAGDTHAEASDSASVLPAGFYKTAVLAYPQIVDDTFLAQDIADYNLSMFNRVLHTINVNVIGNTLLQARKVITVDIPEVGLTGSWYVYGCDIQWGAQGFVNNLELRRMEKA